MALKNITYILAIFLIFLSCKKNVEGVMSPLTSPTTSGTGTVPTTAQLKDSAVAISRNIYLWNQSIPTSFTGNGYADYPSIMTSLRNFSLEPGFAQPVDKWSFAIIKSEWDQMSGGMGSTFSGTNSALGDFGFQVFFKTDGDRAPSGILKTY